MTKHIHKNNSYKKNNSVWNKFTKNLFAYTRLGEFCHKTLLQQITSTIHNILYLLISLLCFVPIVESFVSSSNMDYNVFFTIVFSFSFFFLIDSLISVIVIREHYNKPSYKLALKRLFLSLFTFLEFSTWLVIFILCLCLTHIDSSKITFNGNQENIIIVTTTVILLALNLLPCMKRFMILSHNQSDMQLLSRIILSKLKIWIITIIVLFILIFIFSYVIYTYENLYDPSNTKFKDMGDAIYFTFVTITTVGFGDIVATTEVSRGFVVALIFIGIFMYSFLSSQIINIFTDYFSKKKQISKDASDLKNREIEVKYLVEKMDEIFLKNLYNAGLISKTKYNKLNKLNKNEYEKSNIVNKKDLIFDTKERKIYHNGQMLGRLVRDEASIIKAQNKVWIVDVNNNKPEQALYFLPMKTANALTLEKQEIQIIFSSKPIPETLNKLIVYQKKPFVSTICEVDIVGVDRCSREEIFNKYGIYSNLSKIKYDSLFKKQKNVTAILIKDICVYTNPKSIEEYGISDSKLLKDITPLV